MLIFLVGFMGCGKSFIGRNLAPLMGYDHIDMDHAIEAEAGLSVKEIFEQKGEASFREMERAFLQRLEPGQNLIISTGGGAPCFFDNMDVMNAKGLTIYLNRNKADVIERLMRRPDKRPLLKGLNEAEVSAFYDERLAARRPYYEKAQLFAGNMDYPELYQKIVEDYTP